MRHKPIVVWGMSALCLGLLAACTPANEDIRQWMDEQRRNAKPRVTPLTEPKKYEPMAYTEAAALDPFGIERLTTALRRDGGQSGAGDRLIAPELVRRKEPLEAIPLDAMTMVGSLDRSGHKIALVRIDNLLHQVRSGNYLGQNYGRVTSISESEIVLREIVQDAAGEWIERNTVLQLQEKTQ